MERTIALLHMLPITMISNWISLSLLWKVVRISFISPGGKLSEPPGNIVFGAFVLGVGK